MLETYKVVLQIHANIQDGSGNTLKGSDCDYTIAIRADSVEEAIIIYNDLKTSGKKLTYKDKEDKNEHPNSKS